MTPKLQILGLAGSLRARSYNRQLLETLSADMVEDADLRIFDGLDHVPLFNEDEEAFGFPASVSALCQAVRSADGVVIATPEYNQAIPGVLKNAIDWISRDPAGNPFSGKPVAVTGATVGSWGTRLAQQQTRNIMLACGALVMPSPALYVARATDDGWVAGRYAEFANGIVTWTARGRVASETFAG